MIVEYLRINDNSIYSFERELSENEILEFQSGNDLDGIFLRINTVDFNLEEYKQNKYKEIDTKTENIIAQGFVFDNKTFSLSQNAQINLLGLQLNKSVIEYPLKWTTKDDNDCILIENEEQANLFHLTALETKNSILKNGENLKELIRNSNTKEEIDSISDNR